MNPIQTEVIFLNLLRQADELIVSIVGFQPAADAGSFRARVSNLFETFKANKTGFSASPISLGMLANLLKEYAANSMQDISNIGTPEILLTIPTWSDIPGKPDTYPPDYHNHPWSDITYKPVKFPPTTHQHTTAEISDFPTTMPPTTHQHTTAEISDFPATMPPTAHQHVKSEISDFPTTMTPTAHQHVKSEISDFPTTMPPTAHQHVKSEISDFPTAMTPTAHQHTTAEISDFPATMTPRMAYIIYIGNGASTRTLAFTGGFTARGFIVSASTGVAWCRANDNNFTSTVDSLTLTGSVANPNGITCYLVLWG